MKIQGCASRRGSFVAHCPHRGIFPFCFSFFSFFFLFFVLSSFLLFFFDPHEVRKSHLKSNLDWLDLESYPIAHPPQILNVVMAVRGLKALGWTGV